MSNRTVDVPSNNCSLDFPVSSVLFSELREEVAVLVITGICGVLTVLTVLLYLESIWYIYFQSKLRDSKNKALIILSLYPVVSCACLLSLLMPRTTLMAELLISLYMSICILMFVRMVVVNYLGGFLQASQSLRGEPMSFRTPPCCCCCCCPLFYNQKVNWRNLKIVHFLTFQVAIVRPIIVIVIAVLWADHRYLLGEDMSPTKASMYVNLIGAISSMLAIWGLAITFKTTRQKLQGYRVGYKFASLQLVIVVINIQLSIFQILAKFNIPECAGTRGSVVRAYRSHYFLLILEMMLLMIFARFAYRHEEEIEDIEKREVNIDKEKDTQPQENGTKL